MNSDNDRDDIQSDTTHIPYENDDNIVRIQVPDKVQKWDASDDDLFYPMYFHTPSVLDVVCEFCGGEDDEDCLLLCDGCNNGFHTYCLTPVIDSIPEDEWYCSRCTPFISILREIQSDEESDVQHADNEVTLNQENSNSQNTSDNCRATSAKTKASSHRGPGFRRRRMKPTRTSFFLDGLRNQRSSFQRSVSSTHNPELSEKEPLGPRYYLRPRGKNCLFDLNFPSEPTTTGLEDDDDSQSDFYVKAFMEDFGHKCSDGESSSGADIELGKMFPSKRNRELMELEDDLKRESEARLKKQQQDLDRIARVKRRRIQL
jgi:hypothetical protein